MNITHALTRVPMWKCLTINYEKYYVDTLIDLYYILKLFKKNETSL